MTIDHEMPGTCAPALMRDYLCSAQINVDPQGLDLKQASSIFMPKIGSGTSGEYRGRTRLRRELRPRPGSFRLAARSG
jgi:hypothetical protein